jgi:TrmH family RNA methyltransferase
MPVITSPQNPKVKYVRRLREKRERLQAGLLLVDGYDELILALTSGTELREIFYCPALFRDKDQVKLLDQMARAACFEVDESVFHKISYRDNPDGWLATFPLPQKHLTDLVLSANPFFVVAEAVEKPGNLGAMLRTADAAGVDALISCDPLTDWGNPNIVRASKGTLFTVQVAEASSLETIAWLHEHRIRIVVATPDASTVYSQMDFTVPVALIVGTEHAGISEIWRQAADIAIQIPMFGKVNSLNVATSSALLIYEVVRQRRWF